MSSSSKAMTLVELRTAAERRLGRPAPSHDSKSSDQAKLLRELELHQVELEMQNEELRRALAELAESNDRYQRLYELGPTAHLTVDRKGRILESNLAARALLQGEGREKLEGRALTSFMSERAADTFHLHLQRVFNTPHRHTCELPLECTAQSGLVVNVRIDSIAGGLRHECLCTLVDLAEHKAPERAPRDESPHGAAPHDPHAQERMQAQKLEAIGALASGVAHDINNVLQAILGCVKAARADANLSPKARAYMELTGEAARRGSTLTSQLMAFARKQELETRALSIDAVIAEQAELIRRLVSERVDVRVETRAPDARMLADPVQIEQILMNLAANARDAMPEGGPLFIRTEITASAPATPTNGPGRWLRLIVEDAGTGMDEATRKQIFEPFFTTKEVGKGTGLGLSTVFAITEQLDGHIEVDSAPGQGTRFSLFFPCLDSPSVTPPREDTAATMFSGTALLVDNEPLVRLTVRRYLEELGFDVREAGGSKSALSLCESAGGIDLLVTEVFLPTVPGPKLANALRAKWPNLPVLFISTTGEAPELESSHHLSKPFGHEELVSKLREVFPARAPALREAGGPTVEPAVPQHPQSRDVRPTTLLLVEDNLESRLALTEMLTSEGYRVLAAGKSSEALALVEQCDGAVDVVLSDLRLPDMPGEQLAERLHARCPGKPIVFMSGSPEAPAHAAGFLQKPIEFDELLAVLQDVATRA